MDIKRMPESLVGWLSVAAAGMVLVGVFILAGGLGSEHGSVALASTRSNASARVVTLSVANCAGPTLQGTLGLAAPFTGQVTVGLFFLSQHARHLTRQLIDSGLRASATFNGGTSAGFTFSAVPAGAPAYEVVVLPSSGKITGKTALIESQAMPPCGTRRVTETATTTQTVTAGATVTGTTDVTIAVPSYQTVTVMGTRSAVTLTTSMVFTSTVVTTVLQSTLITSTVFVSAV